MLFNSFVYILLFLPLMVVGYFYLNKRRQEQAATLWLIMGSLVFYGYWNPWYVPIILGSMIFNFTLGTGIMRLSAAGRTGPGSLAKYLMIIGIVANLSLLGYYKYTDFFLTNAGYVLGRDMGLLRLALPLGISFFTFQQLSFLVDCYQERTSEYRAVNFSLFVVFFPQLIAGPIVHHKEMIPQFEDQENKRPHWENIYVGLAIFAVGLFKKAVLADTFSIFAGAGYGNAQNLSCAEAWISCLSYTFQLYFDFSGYTDMGIGSAYMLNIKLPHNFNSPYRSVNIQDFWRRWHMTLSRWLRDYLYIPLGGNRKGEFRTHVNLFLTFLLGGFWHGAGWTFVVWGALHGAANSVHRTWKNGGHRLPTVPAWIVTFLFVNIAWVFFRAASVSDAVAVLRSMAGLDRLSGVEVFAAISSTEWVLWSIAGLIAICLTAFGINTTELPDRIRPNLRTILFIAVITIVGLFFLNSTIPKEFLYFDF